MRHIYRALQKEKQIYLVSIFDRPCVFTNLHLGKAIRIQVSCQTFVLFDEIIKIVDLEIEAINTDGSTSSYHSLIDVNLPEMRAFLESAVEDQNFYFFEVSHDMSIVREYAVRHELTDFFRNLLRTRLTWRHLSFVEIASLYVKEKGHVAQHVRI